MSVGKCSVVSFLIGDVLVEGGVEGARSVLGGNPKELAFR